MASSAKFVSKLIFVTTTIVIGVMMNVITTTEATWCVSRYACSYSALVSNMNWACSNGANCGPIQPGGSCFYPNTIQNHASYAFDSYYQRMGRASGSCYFGGCATIAFTDPSFAGCRYPPRDESIVGETNSSSITNSSKNITKSDSMVRGNVRKLIQKLPLDNAQKQ